MTNTEKMAAVISMNNRYLIDTVNRCNRIIESHRGVKTSTLHLAIDMKVFAQDQIKSNIAILKSMEK